MPSHRAVVALASALVVVALPIGAGAAPRPRGVDGGATNAFPPTITALVSATPTGLSGNAYSDGSALSGDGRFVAWQDESSNLVAGDTNSLADVFVRDMVTDVTERADLSSAGAQADGAAYQNPSISRNGRFVAFASAATNLVPGDTDNAADVFVRDRLLHTTERVSVSSNEAQSNGTSWIPTISGNGRYVVFQSTATDLVLGDWNASSDIFVRDRDLGTTTRVSVSSNEAQATGISTVPSISYDGRFVTFQSSATDLVAGDNNGFADVFERDTQLGTTAMVSLAGSLAQGDADSGGNGANPVSDDGRYIAFSSNASNLVAGDADGVADVFRRDMALGNTALVNVSNAAVHGNGGTYSPSISADGNVVAFTSTSTNIVGGDTNGHADAFRHIFNSGATVRDSVSTAGAQAPGGAGSEAISADGSTVAFGSDSNGLVTTPAGGGTLFVRRMQPVTPFTTVDHFVAQQADDFPVYGLTAAKRSVEVGKILSGNPSYQRFVADLARGFAYSGRRAPVIRLYWAFFLREPDTGGISYWIAKVQGGMKLDAVAQAFAKSSEFKTKYGALANSAFVELVYQNVLGRGADAGGLTYWVAKLDAGFARGSMMTAFSESSEGQRTLAPQTDVVLLSLPMLGAVPTAAQFTAWRALLAGGGPLEDVVTKVMATSAYALRITP